VKEGIPVAKLDALGAYEDCPLFSERERAALAFTEEVTRAEGHVSDACFERLRQQFSEPEVLELMFVIGYQMFVSRFANAFRIAPQGFSDRTPRTTVSAM
jgi:alkylhydroperoxidase family enzyme